MAPRERSVIARRDDTKGSGKTAVAADGSAVRAVGTNGTGRTGPWSVLPTLPALPELHVNNPLPAIERLLRRDETDIVLVVGNIALVAFEVIEWPVAAITLAVHLLARSRFKAIEELAEIAEEAE